MNWWLIGLGVVIAIMIAAAAVRARIAPEPPAARRRSEGPLHVTRNAPQPHERHFYGVSVHPGAHACDAIRKIERNRYLTTEAPKLPLPECDNTDCRCSIRPEDDRRAGYDRRGDSFSAYGNFQPDQHEQKRSRPGDRRSKA